MIHSAFPASVDTRSSATRRRQIRLTAQLRSAHAQLAGWETSIRAGLSAITSAGGAGSAEVNALLETLTTARDAIERRLQELGEACLPGVNPGTPPAALPSPRRLDQPGWLQRLCVKACRACGRSVAAAFRRARAAADLGTAGILYRAMRAFEKQIWLLDPHHGRA